APASRPARGPRAARAPGPPRASRSARTRRAPPARTPPRGSGPTPRRPRRPRSRSAPSPARALASGHAQIAEAPLEPRDDRRPRGLGSQDARADADDRPAARLRALDFFTAQPALGTDEEPDARALRQAGRQARGQRPSGRSPGTGARPRGRRRALPEAELELGGAGPPPPMGAARAGPP